MSRPRILDLFCCEGGAATGYHEAGFDVVGVDIDPQPRYPFGFLQMDATAVDMRFIRTFDAIHASPPCQRHTDLARQNKREYPCFIAPTRALLIASGLPYVIENVEGAPLLNPTMLCGTMFADTRVLRHRLFEANFPIQAPTHGKHPLVYTMDKRKAHYGKLDEWTSPVQVTGGGNCSKAAAADAMGMPWATKHGLNEAIPPAYTRHIGLQLIAHIQSQRIAA
jgi:DNA (cytosine-5)-methyltransferase 1